MSNSEKFCLRWNDFQENFSTAFSSLRKDTDFTDVTLACEDGYQVDAHKFMLVVASSPFFHNLLKRNKHAHPLIFMRGIKSENLLSIVDFLYYGEANIYQENLDTFLNIAEELQLKGLNGADEGVWEGTEDAVYTPKKTVKPTVTSTVKQGKNNTFHTNIASKNDSLICRSYSDKLVLSSTAVALPKYESVGMNELNVNIDTMMYRSENRIRSGNEIMTAYIVCRKEDRKSNLRNHIEGNHLGGASIPCKICDIPFKTRKSLSQHNSCFHTDSIK